MTAHDLSTDPLLQSLALLPALDVDAAHAARIRGRCVAVLGRRRAPRALAALAGGDLIRRIVESALIVGACTFYLVEVVRRAAALYGL